MQMHVNSTETGADIDRLIGLLASNKKSERKKAREMLVAMGKPAVPALVKLLTNPRADLRWEAACILGDIADPDAAPGLLNALEDDVVEVRWRAAEALIQLRRNCLIPLFKQLEARPDCVQLREGAHHILHCLSDDGLLAGPALKVMEALESADPLVTVPWAAARAIEAILAAQPPSPSSQVTGNDEIMRFIENNPFLDKE